MQSEVRQLKASFEEARSQLSTSSLVFIVAEAEHEQNCTQTEEQAKKHQDLGALLAEVQRRPEYQSSLLRSSH